MKSPGWAAAHKATRSGMLACRSTATQTRQRLPTRRCFRSTWCSGRPAPVCTAIASAPRQGGPTAIRHPLPAHTDLYCDEEMSAMDDLLILGFRFFGSEVPEARLERTRRIDVGNLGPVLRSMWRDGTGLVAVDV